MSSQSEFLNNDLPGAMPFVVHPDFDFSNFVESWLIAVRFLSHSVGMWWLDDLNRVICIALSNAGAEVTFG